MCNGTLFTVEKISLREGLELKTATSVGQHFELPGILTDRQALGQVKGKTKLTYSQDTVFETITRLNSK